MEEINWTTIVVSFIVAFVGWTGTYYTIASHRAQEERKRIQRQLDEFYGPIEQLRRESFHLYYTFLDERRKSDENYRLLIDLAENGKEHFLSNEVVIMEQIAEIGKEVQKIILEKGGLVEDAELTSKWLPELAAHTRLFRLALEGKLSKGMGKELNGAVFPLGVDAKISDGRAKCLAKLGHLDARFCRRRR